MAGPKILPQLWLWLWRTGLNPGPSTSTQHTTSPVAKHFHKRGTCLTQDKPLTALAEGRRGEFLTHSNSCLLPPPRHHLIFVAEDFIYLPHNNLRAILIIQRTKDHWRPLAGTVQLGKLENDATNAISCSTNKDAAADAVAADYNKGSQPGHTVGSDQLAGRPSQRAGTLPARWEALPKSWYTTSSLGGTPDELVHYQLAGKHSRQAGTLADVVPNHYEAIPQPL
ncbi:hypothetical protein PCASD_02373 [Puccinia coronata f. sp. avenae]|uniref:Uncharacterized protein n=1 Tax=Puccinia coronata f. sp. avenae TaxID=200324 RepID=A0A2N5VB41_9BASI|nr:hypothetical protein PCASD_02373 [Puccinia coronata f. sp. avenae]